MEQFLKSPTGLVFAIGCMLGAILPSVLRGLLPRHLLIGGVVGLLLVNIVLFTVNTFAALARAKGKTEKELEDLLAPALQGVPNVVGPGFLKIVRRAAMFCLGVSAGALVLLLLRHYHPLR